MLLATQVTSPPLPRCCLKLLQASVLTLSKENKFKGELCKDCPEFDGQLLQKIRDNGKEAMNFFERKTL